MLIDVDILKKMGSTRARIKQVFTAQAGTPDHAHRVAFEEKLMSRIHEGAQWGLKNYQYFYAADLSWNGNIINKEVVPISLFAQGKLSLKECASSLKDLSPQTLAKFAKMDEAGNPISIDFPAFHKIVVGLTRSVVTRRTAAITNKYVKNYPFYEYEPMSTSYVANLKADVLSQRIEMIVNGYGYRHDLAQSVRDMLLYGYSVEFPECAWDKQETLRKVRVSNELLATEAGDEFEVEKYVAREGIPFKRVHPTRMFYDMAYPLAGVNTDTGPSYIGHWNLVPYRTVSNNKDFFNRETILYDTSFASKLVGYRDYFAIYSADSPINFPARADNIDIASSNDRDRAAGVYGTRENDADTSILLTEYFERVIPKDVGLGDYDCPVWLRLVVASDNTVVFGEFIPYCPAVYYGYNNNDGKILNPSFALEAAPFEDQMNNMLMNLLYSQRAALIKIISLDISQIKDPAHIQKIRDIVSGDALAAGPLLIEHQGEQTVDLGQDPRRIVEISESREVSTPAQYFNSIAQLLSIAERILGVSANEFGQSEQREISATESANISGVVQTSLSFMSLGVDEAIAAKKKILYEATMAMAETRVKVPVAGRYSATTIAAAGFEEVTDIDEGAGKEENYLSDTPRRVTVLGDKDAVEFDYYFTVRDGSERPSNTKAAEVMVLMLQQLAQIPGVIQSMGMEGLYEFLNAILRASGMGVDIRFKMQEGQPDALPVPPEAGGPEMMPPGAGGPEMMPTSEVDSAVQALLAQQ
jgi:hypothetical protein